MTVTEREKILRLPVTLRHSPATRPNPCLACGEVTNGLAAVQPDVRMSHPRCLTC